MLSRNVLTRCIYVTSSHEGRSNSGIVLQESSRCVHWPFVPPRGFPFPGKRIAPNCGLLASNDRPPTSQYLPLLLQSNQKEQGGWLASEKEHSPDPMTTNQAWGCFSRPTQLALILCPAGRSEY
ncbi:hypothetical protein CEXT_133561 [Caerostris extrusa]|uniref:Uncharacterized protein n=1 Tax=Caerostris extrusa TaxID=172846 RepID=A0AAV4NB86_CAEEX|nr:hypothetical protein CEXT_133561 [Caerostris extrusa]